MTEKLQQDKECQASRQWGTIIVAFGKRKGEEVISGLIEYENDECCKIVHIWYRPEYDWFHIDNPKLIKQ